MDSELAYLVRLCSGVRSKHFDRSYLLNWRDSYAFQTMTVQHKLKAVTRDGSRRPKKVKPQPSGGQTDRQIPLERRVKAASISACKAKDAVPKIYLFPEEYTAPTGEYAEKTYLSDNYKNAA